MLTTLHQEAPKKRNISATLHNMSRFYVHTHEAKGMPTCSPVSIFFISWKQFQAGIHVCIISKGVKWKFLEDKKKKTSVDRNQKLSLGSPFVFYCSHHTWHDNHARERFLLTTRERRESNNGNGYVTIVVVARSLLNSFHCCNSSCIGCFVGCRHCFVHPLIHPWYIICFLCSSPGFLI